MLLGSNAGVNSLRDRLVQSSHGIETIPGCATPSQSVDEPICSVVVEGLPGGGNPAVMSLVFLSVKNCYRKFLNSVISCPELCKSSTFWSSQHLPLEWGLQAVGVSVVWTYLDFVSFFFFFFPVSWWSTAQLFPGSWPSPCDGNNL